MNVHLDADQKRLEHFVQIPNINTIDLNLLKVFDAIFREGNTARAGQRLGLGQPAVSHALSRLRHALGDDLFVRSARGMLPTPRAEQLAHHIRGGSVCLNSFGRFAQWSSPSIKLPSSLVPARRSRPDPVSAGQGMNLSVGYCNRSDIGECRRGVSSKRQTDPIWRN